MKMIENVRTCYAFNVLLVKILEITNHLISNITRLAGVFNFVFTFSITTF